MPDCVGLHHSNIITQLLIKNDKFSSGKKTKHVKVKFFSINDRVDDGKIGIIDCLIREMWADKLTNPPAWDGLQNYASSTDELPH